MNNAPAIKSATPACPHFGTCGGCQLQDIAYEDQLQLKRAQLEEIFREAGLSDLPAINLHAAEPYGYRNRIRLRVERVEGDLRLGYNIRATTEFLPITTCPIATPLLWSAASWLLELATEDRDAAFWLAAATEVELFCNDDLTRVQITLLCAPRTRPPQGSLTRVFNAAQQSKPQIAGLTAIASDPRTGPTGRTLDTAGAAGLNYSVQHETYWISRGGFFQVNRFLVGKLVELVTAKR